MSLILNSPNSEIGSGKFMSEETSKPTKKLLSRLSKKKIVIPSFITVEIDDYTKAALYSELQIHSLPNSKNLVKILDIIDTDKLYYIVRESC